MQLLSAPLYVKVMASLLKFTRFVNQNLAVKKAYTLTISRHASNYRSSLMTHWNWDWKPDKIPQTPEERAIAAEKYGLRVEDYKPFADDGFAHGDYPDLPPVSINSRDPYQDWDMPEIKRNYKEPLSYDADMIRAELYDANARYRYSVTYMLSFLLGILGLTFGLMYLTRDYPRHQARLMKQLPCDVKEGTVHYTFKPAQ